MDENKINRRKNFKYFLDNLDPEKYQTDFELEGSCNYAFNLVIKNSDIEFCKRVMTRLRETGVEFRRGSAGGGNQLRQPYLQGFVDKNEYKNYPIVEHIHFYGFYIGNYPGLEEASILSLCKALNSVH